MRKNCFKTVAMVCLCVYRVPPPPGVHSTVTRYCNTPLECWNSQLQERELYSREVLNIWCHERVKECRDNDEKEMVGAFSQEFRYFRVPSAGKRCENETRKGRVKWRGFEIARADWEKRV